MSTINTFFTVVLIAVIVFILFKPGNKSQDIIGAIGGANTNLIRKLSGQYPGSGY